jgi:signal recognition particle GTPase
LEAKFEALKKQITTPPNEQPNTSQEVSGPAPDDKLEDGTEKYPLGEFDPNFIRDLTKHTLKQERESQKAEEEKASQQKQYETEREALQESWTEKLGPAQERYPDFHEKGEQLFGTFSGINQAYGEYLTATLMSMDFGPDVLYYLANNLDEADKIVASGPTRATIALGRLESKFADAEAEKQKARPKVSKAPVPPSTHLRGTNAVMPDVPDDTDDLDAFSQKLFKKKK